MHLLCSILCFIATFVAPTPEGSDSVAVANDTAVTSHRPTKMERMRTKGRSAFRFIRNFIREFSRVDTNYVEPQRYNYALMLQNTNTFEFYNYHYINGTSITFSPKPSMRLGPYFGWRWIFLGYTIDLTHMGSDSKKQDFSLSLYSNQIGVDFFYRKSGDVYHLNNVTLPDGIDASPLEGVDFHGFSSGITGATLYYIFNHRKFSYPAAYSQSTIQRRSAGSFIAGAGYTHHKLSFNWNEWRDLLRQRIGEEAATLSAGANYAEQRTDYYDLSIYGGYGYNWVFAHNWLFDISLMAGLGYKRAKNANSTAIHEFFKDFDLRNFNFDGVTRVGLVYNNMRWYTGASAIFHTYNYSKAQFSTNNLFGYVNLYLGINFGKR